MEVEDPPLESISSCPAILHSHPKPVVEQLTLEIPGIECVTELKHVSWANPLTSVLGQADQDYDRRSIKVDLSNTPYALFHKDYYLLKHPEEASPTSPPRQAAHHMWASSDDEDGLTEGELSGTDDDEHHGGSRGRRRAIVKPNFSGVWKRVKSENVVALLTFSGVPKKAAQAAAQRCPIHLVDHDQDYLRLVVKNGLAKSDAHFIIGDEARPEHAGPDAPMVMLQWADATGDGKADSLMLTSCDTKRGVEMIAVRTVDAGGNQMILQQIVRKLATNEEARARHVFKRVRDKRELGIPAKRRVSVTLAGVPATAVPAAAAAPAKSVSAAVAELALPVTPRA